MIDTVGILALDKLTIVMENPGEVLSDNEIREYKNQVLDLENVGMLTRLALIHIYSRCPLNGVM